MRPVRTGWLARWAGGFSGNVNLTRHADRLCGPDPGVDTLLRVIRAGMALEQTKIDGPLNGF